MMQSDWASGSPQFMIEALEHLDFEDLLNTCLVSMGFYNFLMEEKQRKIWIQACTKVLSSFFQNANAEDEQGWIELFSQIKEAATIPQIIGICHLLRKTEKPGKFNGASIPFYFPFSVISEISRMFKINHPDLSNQIMEKNGSNGGWWLYGGYFRKID